VRVLLPVDTSEASRKAVEFAKLLCGRRGDVDLTLFHVVEGDVHAAQKLMSYCREELVKGGVAANSIHGALMETDCLPNARRVSASLAIISEMKSGDHDIVILGRRGTSASIESLIGSVAEHVAREAVGRTVCIVD